jgi:hypothetical protein
MTPAARLARHGPSRPDSIWWAGLLVAAAAAAATAHGLYAVAAASDVPQPVAALYPVMTDGLALVAYSATNRLTNGSRRYAWAVVVTAAGLSGAAQAVYLAGGGVNAAPSGVRFGIVAAAAVAHLLHLIRTTSAGQAVQSDAPVQPDAPVHDSAVQPLPGGDTPDEPIPAAMTATASTNSHGPTLTAAARARDAATRYRQQHGDLPTTSELVRRTNVSRGTAGTVLKGLRTELAQVPKPDDSAATPDSQPTPLPIKIQIDHTPMHHDPEGDRQRSVAGEGR